uniref:Uncharacterized protein n=1 Tax=Oryza glumipatula TaxID=40148 RepID=A0A0E0A2Z6_9ORYZ
MPSGNAGIELRNSTWLHGYSGSMKQQQFIATSRKRSPPRASIPRQPPFVAALVILTACRYAPSSAARRRAPSSATREGWRGPQSAINY